MNPRSKIAAAALALLAVSLPASQALRGPHSTAVQGQFTQAQIEQMVAPIALHPDALLTQILSASTYPIEVVQAQRWVDQNPGLVGSGLEEALQTQAWDPSVKALCGFPTVLKQMSDDLDWTRDLGDAFLNQKIELMDAVQRLRKKALDAGNLKTTPQETVVQSEGTIVIEPASPAVIYVPAYSPLVVYGPGWYYPYWYYPYGYYPPPHGGGYVSFGIGFWWGSACWSHCDWHHHTVFVDAVAFQTFTTRTCSKPVPPAHLDGSSGRPTGRFFEWTHDPNHRKGATYAVPRPAPPDLRERPGRERPAPPPRRPKPGGRRGPGGHDASKRD